MRLSGRGYSDIEFTDPKYIWPVSEAILTPKSLAMDWNEGGEPAHLKATSSDDGMTYEGHYGYRKIDTNFCMNLKRYKAGDGSILLFGKWWERNDGCTGHCLFQLCPEAKDSVVEPPGHTVESLQRNDAGSTGKLPKHLRSLHSKLDIRKTPDPPPRTIHKSCGTRSGVGVWAFWSQLFEINESLPRTEKMTDAELMRQFQEEFPDHESTYKRLVKMASVAEVRREYNIGKYGERPVVSFRYDSAGVIIGPIPGRRANPRPLTKKEIEDHRARYKKGTQEQG